ncbi:MAG: cytochrome c [Deltaproteobacteria bacterium]|nr:cytochrome c [Deltaproteobacteria bacterium]MBW2444437.1 cytochrome c [Deltaproteobacteria bacterium]
MTETARGFRVFPVLAALALVVAAPAGADGAADGGIAVGNVERGETLFHLCTQCHGAEGQGNPDIEAPAIAGLPGWYVLSTIQKFKSGGRGMHPEDYAGMRMRPMSLTLRNDDDVTHVAAYVAGLPASQPVPLLEGGDATRGAALYAPCIACHMPDGSGSAALNAPPLQNASDWYLLGQLKKFKGGIRGSNPLDPFGALMVGMSQMLADEQAMKDVIAHIMTLAD